MIIPIEMFGCKCDNCETQWIDEHNGFVAFTDKNSIQENVSDDMSWHTDYENNKHYCPNCFEHNKEGEIVIKSAK